MKCALFTPHVCILCPTPVHNQTVPSPTPPCGQSRMMRAYGCRGPAGSWSTWPAGRPRRAWGGLRRPGRCAALRPRRPRPEAGCCCHRQDCRGGRRWLETAATHSQVWAHHSSSTGPGDRAYTLTGWWVCLVAVQVKVFMRGDAEENWKSFTLHVLLALWGASGIRCRPRRLWSVASKAIEQFLGSQCVMCLSILCVFWSQQVLNALFPLVACLCCQI